MPAPLGVDSVEHGSYAGPENHPLFKTHGTYHVPTLLIAQRVSEVARTHPEQLPPSSAAKALEVVPHHDSVKRRDFLQVSAGAGMAPPFAPSTFAAARARYQILACGKSTCSRECEGGQPGR